MSDAERMANIVSRQERAEDAYENLKGDIAQMWAGRYADDVAWLRSRIDVAADLRGLLDRTLEAAKEPVFCARCGFSVTSSGYCIVSCPGEEQRAEVRTVAAEVVIIDRRAPPDLGSAPQPNRAGCRC